MDQDGSMLSTPTTPEDIDESLVTNAGHQSNFNNTGDVEGEEQEQFPGAGRPPTPPQNDHLNAAHPGELSPPRSQNQRFTEDEDDLDSPLIPGVGGMGGVQGGSTGGSGVAGGAGTGGLVDKDGLEWRPGAAWKNKKAQDDMARAWDTFVDKDFSLKDFGDVLAHRIGVPVGQPSK